MSRTRGPRRSPAPRYRCDAGDAPLSGLSPGDARGPRTRLRPAGKVVHLMQLVDRGAEPLGQVEVVHRQLVLGVVAAADAAVAARDAASAPQSDSAEVGVVGLDARAA